MSILRNELNKIKAEKEKYVSEAAIKWVEQNVILINEKLNRKGVKRLSDTIVKFDQDFGPFKTKIPAIASQLEDAENKLQLVVTGRANEQKASDMLKQLSYLYKVFSEFFSTDLPILLNTSIFAAAKQNPDVRLDSLQPEEGFRFDPAIIRETFKNALEPSTEEMKLARKIYSNRSIPNIDSKNISAQLLALSFNELQNLTNIEKIPAISTGETTNESVSLNEQLLLEVNVEKLRQLNNDMAKLEKTFQPFAEKLPVLNQLLDKMRDQMAQIQNNAGAGAWDKIKTMFGGGAQKSILSTHELFRNFKNAAVEIVKLMKGAPADVSFEELLDDEKLGGRAKNALDLLGKSVKPGLFGKGQIDPYVFQQEISKLTLDEIDSLARGIQLPNTDSVDPELENPNPEQTSSAQPEQQYNVGDLQINQRKKVNDLQIDPNAIPKDDPFSVAPNTVAAQGGSEVPAVTTNNSQAQTDAQPTSVINNQQNVNSLTSQDVVSQLVQDKKISKKLQTDVAAAVDYLNNNGFKVIK